MGLTLPTNISAPAAAALGTSWPEVDEDTVDGLAAHLDRAADALDTHALDADRHTQGVLSASSGGLATGLGHAAGALVGSADSVAASTAGQLRGAASDLTADAADVRGTKVGVIDDLSHLTEQLAVLDAAGPLTAGGSSLASAHEQDQARQGIEHRHTALVDTLGGTGGPARGAGGQGGAPGVLGPVLASTVGLAAPVLASTLGLAAPVLDHVPDPAAAPVLGSGLPLGGPLAGVVDTAADVPPGLVHGVGHGVVDGVAGRPDPGAEVPAGPTQGLRAVAPGVPDLATPAVPDPAPAPPVAAGPLLQGLEDGSTRPGPDPAAGAGPIAGEGPGGGGQQPSAVAVLPGPSHTAAGPAGVSAQGAVSAELAPSTTAATGPAAAATPLAPAGGGVQSLGGAGAPGPGATGPGAPGPGAPGPLAPGPASAAPGAPASPLAGPAGAVGAAPSAGPTTTTPPPTAPPGTGATAPPVGARAGSGSSSGAAPAALPLTAGGGAAGQDPAAGSRPTSPTAAQHTTSAGTGPPVGVLVFVAFPAGTAPVHTLRPARQLPPPVLEARPGLCCPPGDHPAHPELTLPLHVHPEPVPGSAATPLGQTRLLHGWDPLGGGHERDLERRFVVRPAVDGRPAEHAWPAAELHPEGAVAPDRRRPVRLEVGVLLDLLGTTEGRVVAEAGTPFAARSEPAEHATWPLRRLRVVRPLPAWESHLTPWFAQPGGGLRYRLTHPVAELVATGRLEAVAVDAGQEEPRGL